MTISHLEPNLVFNHFESICSIPHPSGHERKLAEHIMAFAAAKGFEAEQDEALNVVIRVPATPGRESAPVVILQGHIDMVGEANADANHDFLTDPIRPYVDGDLVKARGTTLGADNGLGVAAALAIAEDPEAVHGPLEVLCTVDEEVGLTGAKKLGEGFLEGRIMLNLDGEESNHAYIGCAGGGDTRIVLKVKTRPPKAGAEALLVKVTGLKGGHSGCDIHEQRGNALRVIGRCLGEGRKRAAFALADIKGGNKRNAIAREASAVAALTPSNKGRLKRAVLREAKAIGAELAKIDPAVTVSVEETVLPAAVLDKGSTERILRLLLALPHGVERMSDEIAGLVETSTNLASIAMGDGAARIEMSTRSSVNDSLRALRDRIAAAARLAGADVEEGEPYPGWKPNLKSKLAKIFKEVHTETMGAEPELLAIHAGLETGVIGEKFPGMDMISFGPDIKYPHSPDEQLSVSSVQRFYKLLKALLERLSAV
jgi:dipeptidase D